MTKREAERLTMQADTLRALGFTRDEAEQLRRISIHGMILTRSELLMLLQKSAYLPAEGVTIQFKYDGDWTTVDDSSVAFGQQEVIRLQWEEK